MISGSFARVLSVRSKKKIVFAVSIFVIVGFLFLSPLIANPISFSFAQGQQQLQPVFETPFNLGQSKVNATNPDIWNVGSRIYVTWAQGGTGLMFRESPDGGNTWSPPLSSKPLNLAPAGFTTAPLVSANGSNVYIVWSETIGSTAQILEATSLNYGLNFSAAVAVSNGYSSSITPVVASWGNNVYVAWNTGDATYISCSSSAGAAGSWSYPMQYGNAHEPQLAAWGGRYVYAVSDDSLQVSNNNCAQRSWVSYRYGLGSEPWVWAYGPNVYAAGELKGSQSEVYIEVSNNYGATWSSPNLLTTTLSDAWAPMVWAYGNSAWIAFHTYPGGPKSQVYVYTTSNGGVTWIGPIALSSPPKAGTSTGFPFNVVSYDGQNVFVAWSQQLSTGYSQLYVSYSSNAGSSWTSTPGIDASQNPLGTRGSTNNDLANAAIASYGTNCYAVWQLFSGKTSQVYFSASTLGTVYPPASLAMKPVRGIVVMNVSINGSYFAPNSIVTIRFDGTQVANATSNLVGNFSATFAVPQTTAGIHPITASDGKNLLGKPFSVVPRLSELPVKGLGGRNVTLNGTGFAADSKITISFDSSLVGSSSTGVQGSFSSSYTVPNLAPGKYTVRVIDGNSDSATATFTIS